MRAQYRAEDSMIHAVNRAVCVRSVAWLRLFIYKYGSTLRLFSGFIICLKKMFMSTLPTCSPQDYPTCLIAAKLF
jgi:hypothetical protein